jgi:hypothetical protein
MDVQETPDCARGRRHQQDDSPIPPDSEDSQARQYNWAQLCLISAMGLAVGVMGAAAYIIGFSRDQMAYAEAAQVARRPPSMVAATAGADLSVPARAAVPTSTVSGRVIPALPAKKTAQTGSVLALTQTSDDDTDADASELRQGARSAPAPNSAPTRADQSKQTGGATRHAQRAKPKETFVSRLTAMYRNVVYHRRSNEPGNNPDPYSHP